MASFSMLTPVFTADVQRSIGKVATAAFYLFFPQSCAVHYMQLEECRRGAAKRERVFRSALEGGKRLFSVISRSGTVGCTLV